MKTARKMLVLSIVLLFILLVGGCANGDVPDQAEGDTDSSTPEQAEGDADSSTPEQAEDDVIEVTIGYTIPEPTATAQAYLEWSKEVEELSEGRVKFTHYYSFALIPSGDHMDIWKSVKDGVADIHFFTTNPDMVPLTDQLFTLPFMGWPSVDAAADIYAQLFDKFPELEAEFEAQGVMLHTVFPAGPLHLQTAYEEARLPEDIKGLKYIAEGVDAELITLAGGVPLQVPGGEYYTSIERGLADGVLRANGALVAFGIIPLLDYFHVFGEGGVNLYPLGTIMNPDFWDSLPPDIQQIFIDTHPSLIKGIVEAENITNQTAFHIAEENELEFVEITPEELKVWEDLVDPLREDIVEGLEAEGKPARDIYNTIKQLIEEY